MLDELSAREKKLVYPIIGVIAVILVIVLLVIWWPKDHTIQENINKVNSVENYSDMQTEKYEAILNDYLKESSFDKLYSKIDTKWLTEKGLTNEEDTKSYLFKNYIISSASPNIISKEVFESDEMYVFKFSIESNGERRNVYINETAPYQYTISFEDYGINNLENKTYKYTLDEVDYTVVTGYVSDSLIQYEVTAKNNGQNTFSWSMNNINDVFLILSTDEKIESADITSIGLSTIDLKPGGEITFKVTFYIPLEKQSLIKSIKFENTYKNNYDNDIEIMLNGGV